MLKLLTIVGARPQIIKAAALSRVLREGWGSSVSEKILHTGQHYDSNMSAVFFEELGIPLPDYNLGVGSGRHGEQTAKMIAGVEEVLEGETFDGVVLYGDTNSTLAGAVAAAKLHVPVFHIEAGLRSYNMAMPEEQNRIVCDALSSICFAPTQTAEANLKREGYADSRAVFAGGRRRKVVVSGDVMYDNSLHFAPIAAAKSDIMKRLGLEEGGYILATVHRDNNTDQPERLGGIVEALIEIAERHGVRVVVPMHPRTAKLLPRNLAPELLAKLEGMRQVTVVPPVSFFEIIELERHAQVVMTDSGGVQKESFFFGRPSVILRPETEWVEIVEHGAGVVADADRERIVEAYEDFAGRQVQFPPLFGDGHAAEHIVEEIAAYLS